MPTSTPRLTLAQPLGADAVSEYRLAIAENAATLDNAAMYQKGTISNRPSVSPLVDGMIYRATDTGEVALYNGAAWVDLVFATAAYGKAVLGSGQTISTAGPYFVIQLNSLTIGTWDTTDYRFVCPTAGVYQVNMTLETNADPPSVNFGCSRNGGTSPQVFAGLNGGNIGPTALVDMFSCAAGDTLQLIAASNASVVIDGASMSVARIG